MIRVLIVDDDVPTRVGIRTILASDAEMDVVAEASNGADGCALAAELAPDVVIMDIHLPDIDGIEATRRILSTPDTEVRVLMLTTFDLDEYVFRSLEAGASGFLLKRTRAEELIDGVRAVAEGHELAHPTATTALVAQYTTAGAAAPGERLTDRELDVLALVARGMSNREIADELTVSTETVRTHVKHIYAKWGLRDRAHAVIAAYEYGLGPPRP